MEPGRNMKWMETEELNNEETFMDDSNSGSAGGSAFGGGLLEETGGGDGAVRHYPGGYTDAMKAKELERLTAEMNSSGKSGAGTGSAAKSSRPVREKKLKFTFNEKREYGLAKISEEIEAGSYE